MRQRPGHMRVRGVFVLDPRSRHAQRGPADAITHLSYAIPITRIYQFLEHQKFRFIYDGEHTEASEEAERQRIREEEERKMAHASAG